jgi:hypothetical protein
MKTINHVKLVLFLVFIVALVTACGPPQTLTDTITEEEVRQEGVLCQGYGLELDLQPGKIVCSGEAEGKQAVLEIIVEMVDGNGVPKILRASVDGVDLTPEEIADLNAGLAEDAWTPEEGYAVTSIVITDNDLTITRSLK